MDLFENLQLMKESDDDYLSQSDLLKNLIKKIQNKYDVEIQNESFNDSVYPEQVKFSFDVETTNPTIVNHIEKIIGEFIKIRGYDVWDDYISSYQIDSFTKFVVDTPLYKYRKLWYENKSLNESVSESLQGISIPGYVGNWSAFEDYITPNGTYYIFEHDYCGDETCYLVSKVEDGKLVGEIFETYDDIVTCLRDEDIINESVDLNDNIKNEVASNDKLVKLSNEEGVITNKDIDVLLKIGKEVKLGLDKLIQNKNKLADILPKYKYNVDDDETDFEIVRFISDNIDTKDFYFSEGINDSEYEDVMIYNIDDIENNRSGYTAQSLYNEYNQALYSIHYWLNKLL